MKRLHLWILIFIISLVLDHSLNAEAKSQKNKEKKKDKYSKTEGSAKEAKYRYSKSAQEEYSKKKYQQEDEEDAEIVSQELEEEVVPEQKPERINKKSKKPYTISVEVSDEPVSYKKGKGKVKTKKVEEDIPISSSENKQKPKKIKNSKNIQSLNTNEEGADFIVHVPKNKKGGRHRFILEVAEDDPQGQEDEIGNAIQAYVTEEEEGVSDVSEEEIINEDDSKCYYG